MTTSKWNKPFAATNRLDALFGPVTSDMTKFYPSMDEIPPEFHKVMFRPADENDWIWRMHEWFFKGAKQEWFDFPKEGIDGTKALAHLCAVMKTMESKHEHKIAAAAFLADKWFNINIAAAAALADVAISQGNDPVAKP